MIHLAELPLTLPEMEDFRPTGTPEPPLSKAKEWLRYEKEGAAYTRETNTMPQWVAAQRLFPGDDLALVLDQGFALGNVLHGEHAVTVHAGAPRLDTPAVDRGGFGRHRRSLLV